MAKKAKVKISQAALTAMLSSPEMESILLANGEPIASSAGPGYEAVLGSGGRTRSRVFVQTATFAARLDNARNATLLRAIGGG
jgi:hypothetical protein